MKILKEGNEWWEGKEIQCPRCKSNLKIEYGDILTRWNYRNVDNISVKCRKCNGYVRDKNPNQNESHWFWEIFNSDEY